MMDGLAINAAEDFVNAGYPREASALIIVELDGPEVEVDALIDRVAGIMNKAGASSIKISTSEEERNLFWAGRKSAFPAVGRISPDYLCMDGTIPRRRLPDMMVLMATLSQNMVCGLQCSFMLGMVICTRLFCLMRTSPGNYNGPKILAPIFCGAVSRWAVC